MEQRKVTRRQMRPLRYNDDAVVVAIVHYNTPELTRACIGSLIYNGGLGGRLRVVVFDNSDREPFGAATGVKVIDNTQGQVVDFDAELAKYPERDRSIGCAAGCEFGSVKHMMTVQKLWELIPQGFILMESDVLIRKPLTEFVRKDYSFVGYVQQHQPQNPFGIGRVLPMLCWMNVPLLKKHGARYYDPARAYGLLAGGRGNRNNWYDTGAALLEDIINKRPHLKGLHLDIRPYVVHYGSASWKSNDRESHEQWIEANRPLFPATVEKCEELTRQWLEGQEADKRPEGVAVCAIGRRENRYAVEWVDHYLQLGVSKIFIYDNNREEDGEHFADVLQEYIDSGKVAVEPWEGLQKPCYEHCYNEHGKDFRWMGFFDFDEFVEIENRAAKPHGARTTEGTAATEARTAATEAGTAEAAAGTEQRSVREFLKDYEGADVVVMSWQVMTDNGLVHYDDRPVRERFTEAAPKEYPVNHHVKCFVQTDIKGISFNDPHCPNAPRLAVVNVYGEQVEQIPIQPEIIHDVARVVHYETKSAEEYAHIKIARGFVDSEQASAERVKKAAEYFFTLNERTAEKEAIINPDNTPRKSAGNVSNGQPKADGQTAESNGQPKADGQTTESHGTTVACREDADATDGQPESDAQPTETAGKPKARKGRKNKK